MNSAKTSLRSNEAPDRTPDFNQSFAILPEYFWEELSENERKKRIDSFRETFKQAKARSLAESRETRFWFEFGAGI